VSYRDKTIDTVLGPVTLRRAWYHCAECGHGLAPRDAALGVAGDTMSPGLARLVFLGDGAAWNLAARFWQWPAQPDEQATRCYWPVTYIHVPHPHADCFYTGVSPPR
jgi:hypothetical protein